MLPDVDYGSRVTVAMEICKAVNAKGGTQVPVPSQWGAYEHPSTLIKYLRACASVVGVPVPTDNVDYTHFLPLCNAIIVAGGLAVQPA